MVEHRYEMNRVGDFGRCACGQEIKIITDPRDFKNTSQEVTKPGDPDFQHPKIESKQHPAEVGKTAAEIVAGIPEKRITNQSVPIKPHSLKERWAYYDENKEAILADYHSMRRTDFLIKWHINTKLWKILVGKWGVATKRKWSKRESNPFIIDTNHPKNIPIVPGVGLPPFPEFSSRWNEAVQIAWLNAYIRLKELR
jgi:hypothetical protein